MARDAEQLTAASAPAATKSEAVARIAVSASSRSEDLQNYRKSAAVSSHEYAGNLAQGLSDLPVVDLGPFISGRASSSEVASSSQQLADCLHRTGCLIVRDPRATGSDSNQFLDLVERYFAQSYETKLADSRPQLHYQVGSTPEGVERPKCLIDPQLQRTIAAQSAGHRATMPTGPDVKWRFMWRIGERPTDTQYSELNSSAIIPAVAVGRTGFADWEEVMNGWGHKMLAAVHTIAELIATGFGLPPDSFTSRMHHGPHLLAPTGTNLEQHGKLGTCIAGYHYDLNFLTIHGKSRFPGLFIWLRSGQRAAVTIPDGCLLLQAGKQMEWLTAGHVQAGMHEVICTEGTQRAMEAARAAGRPLWRVSSTVFGHIASDQVLSPVGHFADLPTAAHYLPIKAGEQVQKELDAIRLSSTNVAVDGAV